MKSGIRTILLLLCGLLTLSGAVARAALPAPHPLQAGDISTLAADDDGPKELTATAVIRSTVATYATSPFIIVAEYRLPPHWHAYYTNPGTVGLPIIVEIEPVDGFRVEGPFLAVPQRFDSELGVSYGYEKPRAAFRITPLHNAPDHAVFNIRATIQICRDGECMPPEDIETSWEMSRGDGEPDAGATDIARTIPGLTPRADRQLAEVRGYTVDGDQVRLHFETPPGADLARETLYFFSSDGEIMPTAAQRLESGADGSHILVMKRNDNSDSIHPNGNARDDAPLHPLTSLKGILQIGDHGILVDAKNIAGQPAAPSPEKPEKTAWSGIVELLGMMFIGGLILNLMPCVFPVIGLKILSFVELGGGERKKVIAHSLAFITGILLSFWTLTVILAILKAGLVAQGRELNWAMWMEQPLVIYLLLLLMLTMALSMYGVFEIGVRATSAGGALQQKKGMAGSFWSGVLATVIATPCSAPFLGAAMLPALALPTGGMFMAFTAMALGMALPYLVLSAFPSLLGLLPRPGAWMESFKQGISFLLFGTAAWLLWVYMSSVDAGLPLLVTMLGLCLFAAAWWIYGRWCPIYQSARVRRIGLGAALILGAAAVYMSCPPSQPESGASGLSGPSGADAGQAPSVEWRDWSPAIQEAALQDGRPVYIDFTAKWCLTCQANKKVAYGSGIAELVARHGIVMLKADKTTTNPQIDDALRKLGRASVPVNVLYVPGDPTPHITREILTEGYLKDFLEEKLGKE